MPFPPTGYPFSDDSAPGSNDGDVIHAADINDIIAELGSMGGGTGNANSHVTDYAGAIGPGFAALKAADEGPFVDETLDWGPDYFLYQSPWGGFATAQATNGDTMACASYLNGDFTNDTTKERVWKLVSGAWQIDTTFDVQVGDFVVPGPQPEDGVAEWSTGIVFVKSPDGRLELIAQQHHRAEVARSSAFSSVSADGTDESNSGAPLGIVYVDTTAGDVTRTLPENITPGREMVYINTGNTGNTVFISPNTGQGIVSVLDPFPITGYLNWAVLTFDGTDWTTRIPTIDASAIVYTPITPGDWPGTVPSTVAEALDILAARAAALE